MLVSNSWMCTEKLLKYISLFGSKCLSVSAMQPDIDQYFYKPGVGFIAIMTYHHKIWARGKLNIVIGDPICHESHVDELLRDYLFETNNTPTVFAYLSEPIAKKLKAMKVSVNYLGVEHQLNIPEFDTSLAGKKHTQVRRWINKAQKEGVYVEERSVRSVYARDIQNISRQWLRNKKNNECIGLTRPLELSENELVRCFWAYKEDKLIGYAFFDAMSQNNKITGYYHNIARTIPNAPNGTSDAILLHAIKKFKEESLSSLSLGIAPLSRLNTTGDSTSRIINALFNVMYRHCEWVYPYKGIEHHKDKYRAETDNIYIGITHGMEIYHLMGALKAMRIL